MSRASKFTKQQKRRRRRGKDGRFLSSQVDSKGYLVVKAGPQRDRRVHTLIAEAMLNRKLKKDEDVHHEDGNKLNCDWRNLKVLGRKEHGAVSAKQHHYLKVHDIKLEKEWNEYFDGENSQDDAGGMGTDFP